MTARTAREVMALRLRRAADGVCGPTDPLEALRHAWQRIDDVRHLMEWRGGRPDWQQDIFVLWHKVQELQAVCREAADFIERKP